VDVLGGERDQVQRCLPRQINAEAFVVPETLRPEASNPKAERQK
jgi:hypothetical protein